MAKKAQAPAKASDYEKLGRLVTSVYESGYLDTRRYYLMTFLKGCLAGIGGVVGATIGIALILWGLSLFHDVPLIGRFTQKAEQSIESSQTK